MREWPYEQHQGLRQLHHQLVRGQGRHAAAAERHQQHAGLPGGRKPGRRHAVGKDVDVQCMGWGNTTCVRSSRASPCASPRPRSARSCAGTPGSSRERACAHPGSARRSARQPAWRCAWPDASDVLTGCNSAPAHLQVCGRQHQLAAARLVLQLHHLGLRGQARPRQTVAHILHAYVGKSQRQSLRTHLGHHGSCFCVAQADLACACDICAVLGMCRCGS